MRTLSESKKGKPLSKETVLKRSLTVSGKYRGVNNKNAQKLKEGYDEITNELAYIMGVMYGDGYIISSGGIGLQSIDKDFVDYFSSCVERQFGVRISNYTTKPSILKDWRNGREYQRKGTFIMRVVSVLLRDYIKSIKNEQFVKKLDISQKKHFLRGLWDSEGSISTTGCTNMVNFTHNSLEIHKVFCGLVEETCGFKIKTSNLREQGNYVSYFYFREYIRKFYETIQPTIQRKRDKFEKILC